LITWLSGGIGVNVNNTVPSAKATSCAEIIGKEIFIEIEDYGRGIEDVNQAREPLYTSKPEMERSGMGFTVMEEFMDEMTVESSPGQGTKIKLRKEIG
jgi:stage II sporulation protein AB (anti-sigma F factor)